MSRASNDDVASAGEGSLPPTELPVAARRRALKAMLGSGPVILTFPSVTQAASSTTCQMDLDNAPRPALISDTSMGTPSWFRLLVTEQTYDGGKVLYKYEVDGTPWYYENPLDYPPPAVYPLPSATLPGGYDGVPTERQVYVLADINTQPPQPDFNRDGLYSTWSCMMSMP